MKTFFTLFFSFLCLFSYSQDLELDFAHRFGVIQDGLRHSVEFLEYFEESNTWVVAGRFQSQVRVGINSTESLTSEDETQLGFVAMYNDDWDLLNSFKTGGEVLHADLTETDIIISGSFIGVADFDFNSDENELYQSQSSFGNGYVASYSLSGEFNWVNVFYCEGVSNKGTLCFINAGKVNLILDYSGSQFGDSLFFSQEDLDLVFTSDAGSSVILFQFDLEGIYQYHHHFFSDNAFVFMRNSLVLDSKIYLSFNVTAGEFNAGINEDVFFITEQNSNVLICAYELANFDLLEFYSFDAQSELSGARGNSISIDENNNLIFSGKMTGSIGLRDHVNNETQSIQFNDEQGEVVIFRYSTSNGLNDFHKFSSNGGLGVSSFLALSNGDIILSMSFSENLFFNSELICDQSDISGATYSLIYVNQELNGARVFKYSTGDDQIGSRLLASSSLGNILVGGSFEGEHDMDFAEDNSQTLGDLDDNAAGFIAKYNYDPATFIVEKQNHDLLIYPNPTGQYLKLNSNDYSNSNYKVTDSSGKEIQSGKISNDKLILTNISSGHYTLYLENKIKRFIVK